MKTKTIAILGAGSWGTAVAVHLANCGNPVMLWGHNPQHVQDMILKRSNQRYLPETIFPDSLTPVVDFQQCIDEADEVIIAVPSHAFASLLIQINKPLHGISWLTKGIDPVTNKLPSQLVAERWGILFQ
ncbi:glycerol-3-phosphate dehydrogenase (NAD+) [Legionella hackeliae]|nr:glycerol-3-phosphate dehydrogenase (NAD+) [Legionella hackeliae]